MMRILFCLGSLALSAGFVNAQQPRLVIPIGHNNEISHTVFSPDKKFILTASLDQLVKIWDASSGRLLQNLEGHADEIKSACFSTDSKLILTTSRDSTAKIWDVITGKVRLSIKNPQGFMEYACFSPDGKSFITCERNAATKIREAVSGKVLHSLPGQPGCRTAMFSADGKSLVTTNEEDSRVWEVATGKLVSKLVIENSLVKDAQLSTDGKWVLSSLSARTEMNITWEAATGKVLQILETPGKRNSHYATAILSNNGKWVADAASDSTITIWDFFSGKVLFILEGHKRTITSIKFSADNKLLITGSKDRTAKVWDVVTGKLLYTLRGDRAGISNVAISPDSKLVTLIASDDIGTVWNLGSGRLLYTLESHASNVYETFFTPDSKKILSNSFFVGWNKGMTWELATGSPAASQLHSVATLEEFSTDGNWLLGRDSLVRIFDAATYKLLRSWKPASPVTACCFSKDGKWVLASCEDSTVKVFDAITTNLLYTIKTDSFADKLLIDHQGKRFLLKPSGRTVTVWEIATGKELVLFDSSLRYKSWSYYADFSPDGQWIVTGSADKDIYLWEASTGRHVNTFSGHLTDWGVDFVGFNKTGTKIISAAQDRTIKVWEIATGQCLYTLNGHTDKIRSVRMSNDEQWIVSAGNDGQSKLWNTGSRKEVCTFIIVDSTDYLAQLPSGYYQCSPGAARALYFVDKDLNVITFEQLDIKYNRPDKVLEALGNTDTALIESYRKAWEKRIKKLDIDTTAFRSGINTPLAGFTNREAIDFQQKSGLLKVRISSVDSMYPLDRFNVWVNEAPVYGQKGISIRKRNKNSFDTTVSIKLSQGDNRIETSVTNANGIESYRTPLTINYTPAVMKTEKIRFVGIGIDQFANKDHNLQYSSKDIRDLARKFKEKFGKDVIIDTLFNEKVTVKNVKALKQKLLQTTENDKVIIAYSGHGLLSKEYDYYLSTYAVNFDKPEENGLPYEELENLLDKIPARKKLLLIDACHSGEVDKEDLVRLDAGSDSLIKGVTPVAYKQEGQLGLKNSFELMQSLFVNVGKSTGATIISAAAGTQFALERNDLKNGVFTYAILEAMNKYPSLKISELKKIVGERVEQLTNGLQKPTSRNETIAVDWKIW